MQLISSRIIPFIDTHSLSISQAREALLHDHRKGFILYLSSGESSSATEERVLFLGPREALIWLNEPPEDQGSFCVRRRNHRGVLYICRTAQVNGADGIGIGAKAARNPASAPLAPRRLQLARTTEQKIQSS